MAGGTRFDTLPPLDSRHDSLWRRAVSTQNHAQGAKHPLPNRYDTGLEMWPRGDKWRSGTLPSGRQRRPMVHFWAVWIDSGHLVPLVISFLVDSTAQLRGGSNEPDEADTTDGAGKHPFRVVRAKRRALSKKWESADGSLKSPARGRAAGICRYMCGARKLRQIATVDGCDAINCRSA